MEFPKEPLASTDSSFLLVYIIDHPLDLSTAVDTICGDAKTREQTDTSALLTCLHRLLGHTGFEANRTLSAIMEPHTSTLICVVPIPQTSS